VIVSARASFRSDSRPGSAFYIINKGVPKTASRLAPRDMDRSDRPVSSFARTGTATRVTYGVCYRVVAFCR